MLTKSSLKTAHEVIWQPQTPWKHPGGFLLHLNLTPEPQKWGILFFDTWTHNKKTHLLMKIAQRAGQQGCRRTVPAFCTTDIHHTYFVKAGKDLKSGDLRFLQKRKRFKYWDWQRPRCILHSSAYLLPSPYPYSTSPELSRAGQDESSIYHKIQHVQHVHFLSPAQFLMARVLHLSCPI